MTSSQSSHCNLHGWTCPRSTVICTISPPKVPLPSAITAGSLSRSDACTGRSSRARTPRNNFQVPSERARTAGTTGPCHSLSALSASARPAYVTLTCGRSQGLESLLSDLPARAEVTLVPYGIGGGRVRVVWESWCARSRCLVSRGACVRFCRCAGGCWLGHVEAWCAGVGKADCVVIAALQESRQIKQSKMKQ